MVTQRQIGFTLLMIGSITLSFKLSEIGIILYGLSLFIIFNGDKYSLEEIDQEKGGNKK